MMRLDIKFPDEVSELSVPETHFDRQAHTHHNIRAVKRFLQVFEYFIENYLSAIGYMTSTKNYLRLPPPGITYLGAAHVPYHDSDKTPGRILV